MDEKKILVVEDDLSILDLYKNELTNQGYRVLGATTGGEGLTIARKEKPSLIILDIMLPGMDGFSFLRSIRESPEIAATATIVLTNLGTSEIFVEEGKRLGVKRYLVKYKTPISEVIKSVEEVLNEGK